ARARTLERARGADRACRGEGRASLNRRRGALDQTEGRDRTERLYPFLSESWRYFRRTCTNHALARGRAPRLLGFSVRARIAAVRSVRSLASGPGQALCPPCADQGRRRDCAEMVALRASGDRFGRPS